MLLQNMADKNALSVTNVTFAPFLVFGHFWLLKNTKILCNICLHFARQDRQDEKENYATKVNKI